MVTAMAPWRVRCLRIVSVKPYTDKFEIDAVRQVTEHGRSVAEVDRRLGITSHGRYAWKAAFARPDDVQRAARSNGRAILTSLGSAF
jgi:transposase-like protein